VTPQEQSLADDIYEAIMRSSLDSARSQQSKEFRVGLSDLGYCSERTRRMLDQQVPEDTDVLAAFIGTALGDHIEAACMAIWPDALRQQAVTCVLHGDQGDYNVDGHPDLVRPSGLVIDFKSARGLEIVSRKGPDPQQQFQRHCYAKGCFECGLFDDGVTLDDVWVANVWVDRAADDKRLHVNMEKYDPLVVEDAARWLDDVIYAYINQQEARKEPPREVCYATCGYYGTCRAMDTDVTGLLTDPTVVTAAEIYREGLALVSAGNRLKDQGHANLAGVSGSTGKFSIRWVHVNGSRVEYDRKPYERLDVKEVK